MKNKDKMLSRIKMVLGKRTLVSSDKEVLWMSITFLKIFIL
jgi:hypothetical protein